MTKIKITNSDFFGKEVKLPIAGLVKLDSEGCVEVTDEVAELMTDSGESTEWVVEKAKKSEKVSKATKKVQEVIEEDLRLVI